MYEITYELKAGGDGSYPGLAQVCKYQANTLDELAKEAYNNYRYMLSHLMRGRETIIFFDAHPSPYFSIWVKWNRIWIDPEPIYKALFYERVKRTKPKIPPYNTGKPGCSEKYFNKLKENLNDNRT